MNTKEQGKLIFIISPCRSGSTALLYSFAQIPKTKTYYQPIKGTIREKKSFIMPKLSKGKNIFKETLGHENELVCTYNPLNFIPKNIEYKTLFLFRDPINTWQSWKNLAWMPKIELFLQAYNSAFKIYKEEQEKNPKNTTAMILEELNNGNTDIILKKICNSLNLKYTKKMLYWGHNADLNKFVYLSQINKKVAYDCSGLLKKSKGLNEIKDNGFPNNNNPERKIIENNLRKKYIFVKDQFQIMYQNKNHKLPLHDINVVTLPQAKKIPDGVLI